AGAEWQGSDPVRWQDRDAAEGALVRAGAVVAKCHAVGVLVAFPDQRAQVLEVTAVGSATEDDLDDAGIPDRSGGVLVPLVPCLRQRLQNRESGDAGAATFS